MPTSARILQLAPTACYLAQQDVNKRSLFGKPKVVPSQAIKIYNVYKILKHIYDKDPNYSGMQARCNYLYELLKKYALRAAAIVDNNSGGSVAPVTPSDQTLPQPIDFIVANDTIMVAGDITLNLDGSGGRPDFRGYNVEFARNGQPQYTTDPQDGSTYFGWNRTTGVFSLFGAPPDLGAAQLTERFRISPSR